MAICIFYVNITLPKQLRFKQSYYLSVITRCPYLPEEDTEDEGPSDDSSARLLVLTKNSVADLFNVDTVIQDGLFSNQS